MYLFELCTHLGASSLDEIPRFCAESSYVLVTYFSRIPSSVGCYSRTTSQSPSFSSYPDPGNST
ncbi:hypothetical protein B0H11DRAFT_2269338 [Mycena galericulata]|nr:hypothetical protein B0H11DRAFT_2269338 [Mycena galericulata]